MKPRSLVCCLVTAFAFSLPLVGFAQNDHTWPQEVSDLKPDASVYYGKLANGFRYAIMSNQEPPKNVSLRLRVNAGSLMETDAQQGLAHFLEHMAFNGTKNFSEGEMVEYFQRIGMDFGADTNAHTSFDETVYKIDLPDNSEDNLNDGMLILRDYADGMLLKQEEIEKERGVILSEKRDRNNVMYRGFEAFIKFSFPNSLLSERLPIGLEDVIKEANRDQFESFYKDWYTPDRMLLVVCGDIEKDKAEALIKEYFDDMEAPEAHRPDPVIGDALEEGLNVSVFVDNEAPTSEVIISAIKPNDRIVDTRADNIKDVYRLVGAGILSKRLERLKLEEGASFIEGTAFVFDYIKLFDLAGIELKCHSGMCNETIETTEQELRRALDHGFTEDEVTEVGAMILNKFKQEAKKAPTRKSKDLSNLLIENLGKNEVFTTPEYDLAIVQEAIDKMTPEIVHQAFEDAWASEGRLLFVSGNINPEYSKEDALAVYNKSLEVKVEKPEVREAVVFAYEDFGTPGKLMAKRSDKDLDAHLYRYQNNVRLNFKKTDYEANAVSVKVRFGGGKLEAYGKAHGLPVLAKELFLTGGLKAHTFDEINRYITGKTMKVEFDIEQDAFVLKGETSPEFLKQQLSLLAAYISAPGFREEGLRQAHKVLEGTYNELNQDVNKLLLTQVIKYIASDDDRFGYPKKDELFKLKLEDVKSWMKDALEKGYLEVAVVGDVDEKDVFKAVSETFGALPKREDRKPLYFKERKMGFAKPGVKTFDVSSNLPKAASMVFWHTDDYWNIERVRRLNVLTRVIDDRLRVKIREELGDAYSPFAYSNPSKTYNDFGFMMAVAMVEPTVVDKVSKTIRNIGEALSMEKISADELERAVNPLMSEVERSERTNKYWMDVMQNAQERPEVLQWAKSRKKMYSSISSQDVYDIARAYLKAEGAVEVHIVPDMKQNGVAEKVAKASL